MDSREFGLEWMELVSSLAIVRSNKKIHELEKLLWDSVFVITNSLVALALYM